MKQNKIKQIRRRQSKYKSYEGMDKNQTDFYMIEKNNAKFYLDVIGLTGLIITFIGIINKLFSYEDMQISSISVLVCIWLLVLVVLVFTIIHTKMDFYDLKIQQVDLSYFKEYNFEWIVTRKIYYLALFVLISIAYSRIFNDLRSSIFIMFFNDAIILVSICLIIPKLRPLVFKRLVIDENNRRNK